MSTILLPKIYLIRHGETEWSRSGQHTGKTDLPLTEHGERQARRIGDLLGKISFSDVLTSPLQRALRTCALADLRLVAKVEPDLREWDYGDYEGLTWAEIRRNNPDWDIFLHGCPHGESPEQITTRADQIMTQLKSREGTVAVFSHGHFLRALAVRWLGMEIREGRHFRLETASLSSLGYEHNDPSTPAILTWNLTSSDT